MPHLKREDEHPEIQNLEKSEPKSVLKESAKKKILLRVKLSRNRKQKMKLHSVSSVSQIASIILI
jgi:hypothetical protein